MVDKNTLEALQDNSAMSFFSFITDNYELSRFILPKKKPVDDSLNDNEAKQLLELMEEKDFYEINTIIKSRYKVA